MNLRWFPVVLIIVFALAACEPNYVQQKDLKPTNASIAIEAAGMRITTIMAEHRANVAQLESQLDASSEQLTFDVVSAKRQLVGSTASTRQDASDLIDVQESNGLSEIDRARSRLHQFDAAAESVAASALRNLTSMDPLSYDPTRAAALVNEVSDAINSSSISEAVGKAQASAVSSSQAITQAVQHVTNLQSGFSGTT